MVTELNFSCSKNALCSEYLTANLYVLAKVSAMTEARPNHAACHKCVHN